MLNMVFMQGITPIEPMEKMSFENVGAAADASQGKQFGNILQQAVQELEQAQNNSRADTMMCNCFDCSGHHGGAEHHSFKPTRAV